MKCSHITQQLEALFPDEASETVARMTLLIMNRTPDSEEYSEPETLRKVWHSTRASMEAAADQHAAMTEELESLCSGDTPVRFHPDQIWMLLRAIKVQSQMLELYLPPIHASQR